MNGMLPIKTFYLLLIAGLAAFTLSCDSEELTEPAVYTPKQMRRILTADSSKLWQQTTQHYLEDSCRTGFYVLFAENETNNAQAPFFALFFRDFERCDLSPDTLWLRDFDVPPLLQDTFLISRKDTFLVKAVTGMKSPQFDTTDSLLFAGPPQDSVWYVDAAREPDSVFLFAGPEPDSTVRLIRLLTSQKLVMDVLGPQDQILFREEYEAVGEGE